MQPIHTSKQWNADNSGQLEQNATASISLEILFESTKYGKAWMKL
jgi:hypothetical protein